MTPSAPTPSRRAARADSPLLFLLLALGFAGTAGAIHPNQPQGFDPDRVYQQRFDQIDHVDLFSGTLSLTIPIGPFQLSYNSNVWRYQEWDEGGGEIRIRATPDEFNTGGLGWYLGWGEVFHPNHWYNNTGHWLYVGDDGSRHIFYSQLHLEDSDGDPHVHYTRDGSYLRLRAPDHYAVDIEFPDGSTRHFNSGSGGTGTTYRLEKVWNAFSSSADPDLEISYNADDTLRTVTDRWGRTHYVHLEHRPWIQRVVTLVDVEAFGGQRSLYDFHHVTQQIDVSCKDTTASTGLQVSVPVLTRIDMLAEGTSYVFEQDGQPLYETQCAVGQIEDLPGALQGVTLPTGGQLRWEWQEYVFPPGEGASPFNSAAGVARRLMIEADGTEHEPWTYLSTRLGGNCLEDPELVTDVVYPTGDCSRHYFDGRYCQHPGEGRGWEYGLPIALSQENAGKYLSSQVFAGNDGAGRCDGEPLRSTYLRFRRDTPPGSAAPSADFYNTNRQVEASRVVFHDDGDRVVDLVMSEYDGLGHFRRVERTGDLWDASGDQERRVELRSWSRSPGIYPQDDVTISPSTPWILGPFDDLTIEEAGAHGETVARTEYSFDSDNGSLTCQRRLASGTDRGAQDVLTVFDRDSRGRVTDQRRYGGDLQTLATTGELCADLPPEPDLWTRHTYAHGRRATSRVLGPDGSDGPFLSYDADIDPSSGLVSRRRDANGFEVSYDYDAAGRLLSVVPEAGARTVFSYSNATSTTPAKVRATVLGADGTRVLGEHERLFDDFGRVLLERDLVAGGSWSETATEYNTRGWVTAVSEVGFPGQLTRFLDFDPFGRARTIRPPEGAQHDLRVSYEGERRVTREASLALEGGEAYVSRITELDSHGRLRVLLEPSGPAAAMTATTYDYDVAGRLTRVLSGTAPGAVQERTYSFDNRGFLLSESHPEKGVAGGGSVVYSEHDSGGRAHSKIDGPNHLGFELDLLGRPLEVKDRNHDDRPVLRFTYDGAPGHGLGKLWTSTRHNYLDVPWNGAGLDDVQVTTSLAYLDPLGKVSRQVTEISGFFGTNIFERSYVWDDRGNLARLAYPACSLPPCSGGPAATGRVVDYQYDRGFLTAVPGWADQIDYHPNGQVARLDHANGVSDHLDLDASRASRLGRLRTTGSSGAGFDSGTMVYDGLGNLKNLGADSFAYDATGRLVRASRGSWLQEYSYDRFGNLTEIATLAGDTVGTRLLPVDPATNRLSDALYDGAGNLVEIAGTSYEFNVSGQVVREHKESHAYDGAGQRVATFIDQKAQIALFSARDLSGRLLTHVQQSFGWESLRQRDYIYAGGRLVASAGDLPDDIRHYHPDHLGTARLLTGAGGAELSRQTFLPFGEEIEGSPEEALKFTGHERSANNGSDYMHARHYSAEIGRFLSVDPVRGNAGAPQRLNRYAYGLGNPMRFTDPDGRDPQVGTISIHDAVMNQRCSAGNDMCRVMSQIGTRTRGTSLLDRSLASIMGTVTSLFMGASPSGLAGGTATGALIDGAKASSNGESVVGAMVDSATGSLATSPVGEMVSGLGIKGAGGAALGDEIGKMIKVPEVRSAADALETNVLRDGNRVIVFMGIIEVVAEAEAEVDPKATFEDEITVTATAGTVGADAAEVDVPSRPATPLEIVRSGRSLRGLWDFGCQMSPTTCYVGMRGGGGPGVFTHPYF